MCRSVTLLPTSDSGLRIFLSERSHCSQCLDDRTPQIDRTAGKCRSLSRFSIDGALPARPNGINGITRRVHYPEWGNAASMVVLYEVDSYQVEYICPCSTPDNKT